MKSLSGAPAGDQLSRAIVDCGGAPTEDPAFRGTRCVKGSPGVDFPYRARSSVRGGIMRRMKPVSKAFLAAPGAGLAALAAYDLLQKQHSILRTFPLLGHARYVLETIGPELRQYIVTDNDQERPFNRDQRSWVYASAKLENNYFSFGTDNDIEHPDNYPIIKQRTFAGEGPGSFTAHLGHDASVPSAKILGGPRGRRLAFRPASVVNVSAMSFGSLSGPAVKAMNLGASRAGALHNTGEGGLSEHHLHGGDLVLQIGTGYFGCRTPDGDFDLEALLRKIDGAPVRAIEIKLSQGAKPGLGGLLPGSKVTPEIARMRGIREGEDCVSPSRHSAFHDIDSMLDFVERIADATGLPVGIKSAVGWLAFWEELADAMRDGQRGVDFITIDGGEGGTGAAPLVFADHVAYPLQIGFAKVQRIFHEAGIADRVTWIASGKVGLPNNAIIAFALGADMLNVAREAMFAIGCLQAQRCHTGYCPTGIATQHPWLVRGVDPDTKGVRLSNYIGTLRRDLLKVAEAVGVVHPALITAEDVDMLNSGESTFTLAKAYGYAPGAGLPSEEDRRAIVRLMAGQSDRDESNA